MVLQHSQNRWSLYQGERGEDLAIGFESVYKQLKELHRLKKCIITEITTIAFLTPNLSPKQQEKKREWEKEISGLVQKFKQHIPMSLQCKINLWTVNKTQHIWKSFTYIQNPTLYYEDTSHRQTNRQTDSEGCSPCCKRWSQTLRWFQLEWTRPLWLDERTGGHRRP